MSKPYVFAIQKYYEPIYLGNTFSIHGYNHPEHTIDEMLHDAYFKNLIDLVRQGDHVFVIDTFGEVAWFRIESVIRDQYRVKFSKARKIPFEMIADSAKSDGYCVKWRGPRGGLWCICKLNGDPHAVNYKSRADAERELQLMRERGDYTVRSDEHKFRAAGDKAEAA